jgi:hypothetical protein
MINPQVLEIMRHDIQAERQKAAEMDTLARACRSSGPNLREIVGNFIISIGLKVKGQLQVKPDVPQAEAI